MLLEDRCAVRLDGIWIESKIIREVPVRLHLKSITGLNSWFFLKKKQRPVFELLKKNVIKFLTNQLIIMVSSKAKKTFSNFFSFNFTRNYINGAHFAPIK